MSNFDDIVDPTGLSPAEEARLRRTHDLLVAAGPPPDLPPALAQPPSNAPDAEILQFPLLPKRRWAVAAIAAAALVGATFFGGYLLGHDRAHHAGFHSVASLELRGRGPETAFASLQLGRSDSVGNWPMVLSVSGLPKQKDRGAYYELFVTRNGKPTVQCGGFRVHGSTTVVRFTVPYAAHRGDGWVVTVQHRGLHEPGPVILST